MSVGGTTVAPGAADALAALQKANGGAAPGPPMMPQQQVRPLFVHTVPPAMKDVANGITKIGIVKLLVHEEMMASERGGNNPTKTVYELVKESFRYVEVDGKKVKLSTFDATADAVFDKLDPLMRIFVTSAYNKHHALTREMAGDFLEKFEVVA